MVSRSMLAKEIDCPVCFVKMEQEQVRGVTVDVCPNCTGTWLDRGELRRVLGDRKLADYLTKAIGTRSESRMVCPRCGGLMDHKHAEGLVVDVCVECHGVWLDPGELEGLETLSRAGFEGDPAVKAQELYEEQEADRRRSRADRFFRRLGL